MSGETKKIIIDFFLKHSVPRLVKEQTKRR